MPEPEHLPAVSIRLPRYIGAAYLGECLGSILGQSYTDFEVVAVDNCSKDDTVAILRQIQERESRLRIIENPRNLGLVGNWNRCIQESRGNG